MWDKRRGCGSQGVVWHNSALGVRAHTWVMMYMHRLHCRSTPEG